MLPSRPMSSMTACSAVSIQRFSDGVRSSNGLTLALSVLLRSLSTTWVCVDSDIVATAVFGPRQRARECKSMDPGGRASKAHPEPMHSDIVSFASIA